MTVSSTSSSATTVTTTGGSAPIQFSGLASGLDTASIISQLMAVESAPETVLKNKVATEQAQVTALQQVNTAFAALATSAQSFMSGSTWTQLTTSSSNTAVSVTASSSAVASTFNVTVEKTAASASASLTSAQLGSSVANQTFEILDSSGNPLTANGSPITFSSGDGSATSIAKAINAATGSGLRATVVHATSGDVLQITSASTGASSNFSLATADGATTLVSPTSNGADGLISLGDGMEVSSSTNTFTVMDGVQVSVAAGTAAGTQSTVSLTDDGSSRATALNTFVQQINSLLTSVSQQTAYGTITAGQAATGAGVLAGNSDLRDLATQLVNTIFPPDGTSLATYGLAVDSTGQLTFDQSAFTAAYQANPSAVQAAFAGTGGFADRVNTLATQASDPYDGSLTQTITSMNSTISQENDQIADWDLRLSQKQATLEQIYSNLETALATMQSQQQWLSSEIASLDTSSSSSSS
jgi:flagellar hook-associated protein 2